MTVDLTLRESIRLKELLAHSMECLKPVNDDNYPHRKEDGTLLGKLIHASDAHWNK